MHSIDWPALRRLRQAFLDGSAGVHDYWQTESDLASYDATFGKRIRWKWDYVLAELTRLGWQPPLGTVLDWGCGSGVASRAFLDRWPARRLFLSDRSPLAMKFAARCIRAQQPDLDLWLEATPPPTADVLLVSHVLTEVDAERVLACRATAILWVEPGTAECSRKLIAVRERLRSEFHVVAPCTHQAPCGLLVAGHQRHWCHFFATAPAQVFTDGFWARFGHLLGIDPRQLPLSYLVLDRRAVPPRPPNEVRVLGRPRVYKAHAAILGCAAEGLMERRLMKRRWPAEYRRLRKGNCPTTLIWHCSGDEIVEMKIP